MSEMSGEITIVTPGSTVAGSWKQSDFPPPVARHTETSYPLNTPSTASRCFVVGVSVCGVGVSLCGTHGVRGTRRARHTACEARCGEGSWKHSDFPPPVARQTETSYPERTPSTASRCWKGIRV